jgi:hypothetical protein
MSWKLKMKQPCVKLKNKQRLKIPNSENVNGRTEHKTAKRKKDKKTNNRRKLNSEHQ